MCGAEKQLQRVCAHEGVVRRRKTQWTTDFSQNSGTYIVYNYYVNCSNSSFSLVMVTPTSHFFVFHWLQFTSMCYLFPIGYLPKPTSMGGCICHQSPSLTVSIGQSDIPIITLLILSLAGWSCQHISWYNNTCRAWWHSDNYSSLINVSIDNICCVQPCRTKKNIQKWTFKFSW